MAQPWFLHWVTFSARTGGPGLCAAAAQANVDTHLPLWELCSPGTRSPSPSVPGCCGVWCSPGLHLPSGSGRGDPSRHCAWTCAPVPASRGIRLGGGGRALFHLLGRRKKKNWWLQLLVRVLGWVLGWVPGWHQEATEIVTVMFLGEMGRTRRACGLSLGYSHGTNIPTLIFFKPYQYLSRHL